jgi:hypothetical protein
LQACGLSGGAGLGAGGGEGDCAAGAGAELDVQDGVEFDAVGGDPGLAVQEVEEADPGDRDGVFAVWKLPVGAYLASNSARDLVMLEARGLPEPTQAGSGISAIIVLPLPSLSTRW